MPRSLAIFETSVGSMPRSEEHTSELQSQSNLVCRLLLEKKKQITYQHHYVSLNPCIHITLISPLFPFVYAIPKAQSLYPETGSRRCQKSRSHILSDVVAS